MGEGQLEAYKDIGIEHYQFVSALGERTCDTCGGLDGKVFSVSEAMEGDNYPPMHANCRCTTIMADADLSSRIARDPLTGENYKVDGDMTFGEWKDSLTPEQRAAMEKYVGDKFNYSSEKGISGKHITITSENQVNMPYIQSKEYADKFKGITDNPNVNRALYKYSKAMLIHRNGTYYEDLYLINSKDGSFMCKQTNMEIENEVIHSKETKKIIKENRGSIIALHNHGTNNPPTGSDLNSAGYNRYNLGVIACHNGDIYIYKTGAKPFSAELFDKTVDKYRGKGYTNYGAYERSLNDFVRDYGIEWRKI